MFTKILCICTYNKTLFCHIFVVLLILQSVNLFMLFSCSMLDSNHVSALFSLIKYQTTMAYNNNSSRGRLKCSDSLFFLRASKCNADSLLFNDLPLFISIGLSKLKKTPSYLFPIRPQIAEVPHNGVSTLIIAPLNQLSYCD